MKFSHQIDGVKLTLEISDSLLKKCDVPGVTLSSGRTPREELIKTLDGIINRLMYYIRGAVSGGSLTGVMVALLSAHISKISEIGVQGYERIGSGEDPTKIVEEFLARLEEPRSDDPWQSLNDLNLNP